MKYAFSAIPSWFLFLISISPMLLGEMNSNLWYPLVIFVSCFFSIWAYLTTKTLQDRNKYDLNLNFSKFTKVLLFVAGYTILLSIYLLLIDDNIQGLKVALVLIALGNVILLYCFIWALNFMSKLIATLEFRKPVEFSQYAGYLFCLFFFPIGIWWVNPKIIRLKKSI